MPVPAAVRKNGGIVNQLYVCDARLVHLAISLNCPLDRLLHSEFVDDRLAQGPERDDRESDDRQPSHAERNVATDLYGRIIKRHRRPEQVILNY
jgi:hypothetical protein